MTDIFSNLSLFLPQIILGSVLGMFLSVLGIILVLRKMAFFGIALSQVSTFSFALTLFFGLRGDVLPLLFSIFILVPIFYFTRNANSKSDTILAILFVSFGSLSQILLSFGGNVQNHLLAAYFGDILTSEIKLQSFMVLLLFFNIFLFILFYHKIIFYSFDPDEYKVRKYPKYTEIIFLIIVTSALSISVNLLGSFYSGALLIIPGFTALYLFRNLSTTILFAIILSTFTTFTGFVLSLKGVEWNGETIYFPTSSTIVVLLAILSSILIGIKRLKSKGFPKKVK